MQRICFMINVENLIYEYPGKRALADVSFKIKSGSVTALVGPNGAGKTTLLKCLAALTKPFGGRISVRGVDILKEPRKCHQMMGFLPDFFGLYDSLTVRQSLTYFAMAQKLEKKRIPDRVESLVEKLDMKDKFREKVGNLSRGMRQRLAIGQAMIHDPELLLLDEPASGLDPESRNALSELFLELNRDGKTLIVSSHILYELEQYAGDILILRDGRIVDRDISAGSFEARRIRIRVLNIPDSITGLLEKTGHVENVRIHDSEITLDFTGDGKEQHDLLKSLMNANVTVKEFYVKKQSIQDQYLETAELRA
ncbi:ABC transporter ATP-binding protein [Desulfobacterales bacterium HSG2]|nr:ABC transporter ATP-binding protein [Desulfobacterales bacterium HSG2]